MAKIEVENVLQPGKTYRVEADKFNAMRASYLGAVPVGLPGATPADVMKGLLPALPADLFPGGEKAGWWAKCVQLDLEAKGVIRRNPAPPVRLYRG